MLPSILLTGFEPFGGQRLNPSAEVVRLLSGESIAGLSLHTLVLPVDVQAGPARLVATLRTLRPDWCVMLGEARGRATISVERVAVNLCDFRIPDNGGNQIADEPVVGGGPAAYFATLPVRQLAAAIAARGAPVELSLSAGSFLCNYLLYIALHTCAATSLPTRCGFIHLPALPAQVAPNEAPMPTLELNQMQQGILAALTALAGTGTAPTES